MSSVTFIKSVGVSTLQPASYYVRGSAKTVRIMSYSVIAVTQTSQLLQPGTNATALYLSLNQQLSNAVADNSFTNSLQSAAKSYGATVTANADATSVTSSNPVEVAPSSTSSSSSTSNELSGGDIAGIVIGVIAFVVLVAAAAYYFMFIYRPSIPQPKGRNATRSKQDEIGIEL